MGTALTGTTPQDTYDSLIKVTDNGPIGATAKYLSDGLGNDSVLALSNARVGVNTASPSVALEVDGAVKFSTSGANGPDLSFGNIGGSTFINNIAGARNYYGAYENVFTNGDNSVEYARITNTGNVGIGTDAPTTTLDVVGATATEQFRVGNTTGGTDFGITVIENDAVVLNSAEGATARDLVIQLGGTERARFTSNGLTFNGDTTAANALDDYEEGTFTVVATPAATGTITLSTNTARYTKIGRQVSIQFFVTVASVSSPVGTAILFSGLPFTIANTDAAAGSASGVWADASAYYVKTNIPSFFIANQTQIYAPIDASTVAAADEFFVNMTYTV